MRKRTSQREKRKESAGRQREGVSEKAQCKEAKNVSKNVLRLKWERGMKLT